MEKLFSLTNKTAFVAGGGGYLGESICAALAAHGAAVVVADLNENRAQEVSNQIIKQGGEAAPVKLDVGDESSIKNAFEKSEQVLGSINVLVNCTTYATGKTHEQLTSDDWQACLKVTLSGAFVLSKLAGEKMLENDGGSIIHFSSMYGLVSPDPRAYDENVSVNPPDYGAAKAGIKQLTKYQAVMWAKQGIRVNAIVPGPFPNPAVQDKNPQFIERLRQRVPMGRIGQAKEIAGGVVYLASDAASYTTGTSLVIDGGWTAW